MCTDSEIIPPNHDDGARANVAAWIWTAHKRQRPLQIITHDRSTPLAAFTTNLLVDGSARTTSVTAL